MDELVSPFPCCCAAPQPSPDSLHGHRQLYSWITRHRMTEERGFATLWIIKAQLEKALSILT